jgi:hypothetical protein
MSTTFFRGENPLKADKLNSAFAERVSRAGDTMQGMLRLAADPVAAFDAATKQYVDRFTSMGVPTGAYIGSAPPGNTLGPLWWDTNSGQLFIQYNDGTSTQWVSANSIDAAQLEGSFLPLTGGTMTGPINYTASGGNTPRSAQDRAAEVVNVKDFGAIGDGVTDDTAAIQAAAATLNGDVLYFPVGTYAVSQSTLIPSNTIVRGEGPASIMLAVNTPGGWQGLGSFLINKNHAATVITDHDITIEDMTFDYGTIGALPGGGHQVEMAFVRNVIVRHCVFQCRVTHNNATAFVGCYNTLVDGCSAYEFNNCAYDHWWGASYGRVVNCYASSAASAQVVNWNPDSTAGGTAYTARGFVLANNTFISTGAAAIPMQIEPLHSGTVADVVIQGNTLHNVILMVRGDVRNAVIADNVFDTPLGGGGAIAAYAMNSANPANLSITGNMIVNPATVVGNIAVIRIETNAAVISGNAVIGATVSNLDTGSFTPVVAGNYFSPNTMNSNSSVVQIGQVRLDKGLSFSHLASAATTTTDGIDLAGGFAGITQTPSNVMNFVQGGGGAFNWYINTTRRAWMDEGGVRLTQGLICLGLGSSPTDLTRGLAFDDGSVAGISASAGNTMTFVEGGGGNFSWLVGGVQAGVLGGNGLNITGGVAGSFIQAGTFGGAPTWTAGNGAPSGTKPIGSLYSNVSGGTGSILYVSRGGGTWIAVPGV